MKQGRKAVSLALGQGPREIVKLPKANRDVRDPQLADAQILFYGSFFGASVESIPKNFLLFNFNQYASYRRLFLPSSVRWK